MVAAMAPGVDGNNGSTSNGLVGRTNHATVVGQHRNRGFQHELSPTGLPCPELVTIEEADLSL
tara:strand:- start:254 stop:442 length:189 start_codon:yes stop_codon:yes gene_type:complete